MMTSPIQCPFSEKHAIAAAGGFRADLTGKTTGSRNRAGQGGNHFSTGGNRLTTSRISMEPGKNQCMLLCLAGLTAPVVHHESTHRF
jgi:hypothetical protein